MKRINYFYNIPVNVGNEETPVWEENLYQKSLPYSAEAEEIAKREAYNGEYTIEDDGEPDPIPSSTQEERIAALEEENAMLLECILEMSEIIYA